MSPPALIAACDSATGLRPGRGVQGAGGAALASTSVRVHDPDAADRRGARGARSESPTTPTPQEPEVELVAACVRGDAAAWRRFHARFHPLVVRVAARALERTAAADDPADLAQDVAADVFAELLASDRAALARFEGRSSVATWLAVLARRRASCVLRRRRPGALDEPARLEAHDPSPSDAARVSEQQAIVRAELETLSPRDRLALQLFYEGQRSYEEVAAALDLPANRVGTLLARARQRLARALGLRRDL